MHITSNLFSLTNKITFTFRELRSFRAFYISQNFRNTSLELNSATVPQVNKPGFTYIVYGNAEAISPAQRRRFRESQRTFPFFNGLHPKRSTTGNNSTLETSQKFSRKLSLFSTKRTKQIYAFSRFQSMRYLLYGNTLAIKFNIHHSNPPSARNTELSASLSLFNQGKFTQIMTSRTLFEPFFKFFTTYRQVQIPSRQGFSISRIDRIKEKSFFEIPRQSSDTRIAHRRFLEDIFVFSDIVIVVNELLGRFSLGSNSKNLVGCFYSA